MPLILEKHRGMEVYLVNFIGCSKNQNEMISELIKIGRYFKKFPKSNGVYAIIDVSDVPLGPKFMDKAIELNRDIFSSRAKAIAVLGVTGIKKILLSAFNRFSNVKSTAMPSREEALTYLYEIRREELLLADSK